MNSGIRINSYGKCSQERGLTLIEALVVLVIAGILVAFGVPRFELLIKNNRVVTTTNEVVGAINYARIEAIKRGDLVHLGPNAGDPNVGWVVWIDDGNDTPGDVNDQELRVWPAVPDGVVITVTPSNSFYVFNGTGGVDKSAVLQVCDDREGESGSTISLLTSGRLNRSDLSCS